MSWHRADNDALGPETAYLTAKLPAPLGLAAIGLMHLIRCWCSERGATALTPETVYQLGRIGGVGARTTQRILEVLVNAGSLDFTEEGYTLRDSSVVAPPAKPVPETGATARQRRWRASRMASLNASTVDGRVDAPVDGSVDGGVTAVDGGASTRASTSIHVQVPVHAQVHTHAGGLPPEPPGSPEGGSPSAHTLSPQVGVDAPQSNTTAPSRPSHPPAGATAPTGAPEAQEAPVTAKPKKARPARSLPPRKALGEAYAAGISQVTGSPCSPPSERWELEALEAALGTHAPGVVGAEALGWVTSAAKDFAQAKAEDRWTVDRGFPPKMAKAWLDGGNRPPPRPLSQKPKGGPMVRKGPGPDRNWLLDDEPIDRNATLEDLTRDLFAMPADILQESAQ